MNEIQNMQETVNAPVRIAQFVGRYNTGGVEAVVMNYYRFIDHSKVQFDFIWNGFEETPLDKEIRALGGRIYNVTPYSKNLIKNIKDYYDIFVENKYSIVHSHLNTLSVFPLMAAKLAGVKVRIAHNHSTASKGEPKTVIKYMLRPFAKIFPTHYFACSAYAGKWLFGDKYFSRGKVRVIPNAIDIEKYSFNSATRQRLRKDMGLENKLIFGHVGRFVFPKNHEFLIDIFYEIHKRNKDTVLILIGDGPLQNKAKNKVAKLGLSGAVRFLGVRNDVSELLQIMDVFILPSVYEGFPVAGVEAQAAGLICFFSDRVPSESKISETVNFLSIDDTAGHWADQILNKISSFNRNRNIKMIDDNYNLPYAAKKLADIYLGLYKNMRSD